MPRRLSSKPTSHVDQVPIDDIINEPVSSGYKLRKQPQTWHLPTRSGMQEWVSKTFKYTPSDYEQQTDACKLFQHQHIIRDFLQSGSPNRGLLLYHGLGVGKTRASIAIAESLATDYKITVMLPASLERNYVNEIMSCGNHQYKLEKRWSFHPVDSPLYNKARDAAVKVGVRSETVKTNKGVWIGVNKTSNYDALSDREKKEVVTQVKDMIESRYQFVHYNGLSQKMIKEWNKDRFMGHIVIIDEVHNFISQVVNNSKLAKKVYNCLMEATNAKLVMLSGTPMINRPFEVGTICNLAKGFLSHFNLTFAGAPGAKLIMDALSDHPNIDYVNIDLNVATIVPLPMGFKWSDSARTEVVSDPSFKSLDELMNNIVKKIKSTVNMIAKGALVRKTLLPPTEEEFDEFFMDYDVLFSSATKTPIKNEYVLARRILGLVSYFESYDKSQFPEQGDIQRINVPMSAEMFTKYAQARSNERQNEMKQTRGDKSNGDRVKSTSSTYRAFSRAVCNFVFPQGIKRTYPRDMRKMQGELDDLDARNERNDHGDENNNASKDKSNDDLYKAELEKAMSALRATSGALQIDGALKEHSPKYHSIINKLQSCKGTALVYSQFRNVEGLGVFGEALKANGWCELIVKRQKGEWKVDVKKVDYDKPKFIKFGSDKEKNDIMMKIFNNDLSGLPESVRVDVDAMWHARTHSTWHASGGAPTNLHGEVVQVMMITQSGAEGISLKNVRQVHLMEPYWNDIRIKQVVGRAVRAGSHLALPQEERKVEVFLYVAVLTKEQAKGGMMMDGGITSDEFVFDIAKKKRRITDAIQNIMQSSSVDCRLHSKDHANVACLTVPRGFKGFKTPEDVLYATRINDDPSDHVVKQKTLEKKRNVEVIALGAHKIPYDIDTNEAFHPEHFNKEPREIVIIGKIIKDGNKYRLERLTV